MSAKPFLTCLKASLVAALLLFVQSAYAQSKKAAGPSPFPDLESAIEARRKDLGSDLTVYIANKDSIVYQKFFGETNARTSAPIGAASQWLVTALVLQLVDEGKLSLDDKVTQYLPVFGNNYKNYVTIRHCLTGLTGIKAEPFKSADVYAKISAETLAEEVTKYARREIKTNAGEAYNYNGMGYTIVAQVAEVVTKKKFEQLMRQRFFTPLGMRNTSFSTDDGTPAQPAFSAKSTAADLIRFLQMLLNGGTVAGKKILSEESIAEMRKVQIEAAKTKGVPKYFAGLSQTLGVWGIEGSDEPGAAASALAVPGLTGVWPMVDFSRGYAFVLLPKSFTGEQNSNVYTGLKQVLDEEWKVKK